MLENCIVKKRNVKIAELSKLLICLNFFLIECFIWSNQVCVCGMGCGGGVVCELELV